MSTYLQILYQVVFGPKDHKPVLLKSGRSALFKYMWRILENKKCFPYQINGVENHLHLVFSLHPSESLSAVVKDLKVASSMMIKREGLFKDFGGWQSGYAAFTYSIDAKTDLIEYVKNQEKLHMKMSFRDELIFLLKKHSRL